MNYKNLIKFCFKTFLTTYRKLVLPKNRSSRQRCSITKGVLRNFAKFTGKHLCRSLFFNKVTALDFIKKETLVQVLSCEFCKIPKNTFFTEHLGRLLL